MFEHALTLAGLFLLSVISYHFGKRVARREAEISHHHATVELDAALKRCSDGYDRIKEECRELRDGKMMFDERISRAHALLAVCSYALKQHPDRPLEGEICSTQKLVRTINIEVWGRSHV
jgi:hypothetical protein